MRSLLALASLTFLLIITVLFRLPPAFFFALLLLNGCAQSAFGAYLQCSVLGIAALFGPLAIEAVLSGHAAIAVIVSGAQTLGVMASLLGSPGGIVRTTDDGKAGERSIVLFFALSIVFLVGTARAHAWFTTSPVYKAVIGTFSGCDAAGERQGLVSAEHERETSITSRRRIWSVARANSIYETAIFYIF